jgi:hypothetical protein
MTVEIINPVATEDVKASAADAHILVHASVNKAMEIVKERKLYRETKTTIGILAKKMLTKISKLKYRRYADKLEYFLQSMIGVEAIFDPISASNAQNLIYAIEALTINIVQARSEDPYGLTQQYLPSALFSLLALDLAIQEYGRVIREIFAAQRLRYINYYRALKELNGTYIAHEIHAIAVAVDEGISRLVRVFYDIIPKYPFPSAYADILSKRLAAYSSKQVNVLSKRR